MPWLIPISLTKYQFDQIPENGDMKVTTHSLKAEQKIATGGQMKVYVVLMK